MTYHCGISIPGMHRDPAVVCDRCGLRFVIVSPPVAAWFLADKPPPKWKRSSEGRDTCRRCSSEERK